MSDLQRNALKARILQQEKLMRMSGAMPFDLNEKDEDEERDSLGELGNMGPPPARMP